MKRQHLLAALALAAVTGCRVENGSSIEITGRAAPSDAKTCEFAAGGKNLLGNGLYDVALGGPYGIALYVQNNLVDPSSIAPGSTTQSKGWAVESARVRVNPKEYTDRYKPSPALAAISGESTLPVAPSSTIEPAGGNNTIVMNVLSDGLLAALQAGTGAGGTVVLGITLEGRTNDGARLDSTEWPFPLDVCSGCLSAVPTCATGTTLTPNTCLGLGQLGVESCQ
jgi:hypothetical protein